MDVGFTKYSIQYLRKTAENSDNPVLLSLALDEMSLHQHVDFDGNSFVGATGM